MADKKGTERPNPLDALNSLTKKNRNAADDKPSSPSAVVASPTEKKKGRPPKEEDEKNDNQITLYVSDDLLYKIEDMRIQYRRRKRQIITTNGLLRLMIERMAIDDLL